MNRMLLNKKMYIRCVSMLLCLTMLFFAFPNVIYAELAEAVSTQNEGEKSTATEAADTSMQNANYELTELREEYTKHFHLENGTYIAAQYDYPVHYLDGDGVFQDIDNRLEESFGGVYTNKNARIKFAKKITGNDTIFTLHDGNTKLTFSLSGAIKGTRAEVENYSDDSEADELQKMMNLEKLSSKVVYKGILEGVDLEYIANSSNIKENIIVKEKSDSYTYSFELKLNGLTAGLSELSGDILVFNKESGAIQYTVPAPVVFDAQGECAPDGAAYYSLTEVKNGKYLMSVTVDAEWMNASNRAYPVTVDPAIMTANSAMSDTYISRNYPTSSYGSLSTMYVSKNEISYWKTTLPSLPQGAHIINADVSLYVPSTASANIGVYEVVSFWGETMTWNGHTGLLSTLSNGESGASTRAIQIQQGQLGTQIIDYNVINSATRRYSWDITPLVEKWYNSSNFGIAFYLMSDDTSRTQIYTSEHSMGVMRPSFTVNYRDMKGVEDYLPYSSHSVGAAGSGSVNLSTGGLTLVIPTLSTTDSLMPYTPSLIYNSSMSGLSHIYPNAQTANTGTYMPLGFKLNLCETVLEKNYIDSSSVNHIYYVYSDADGTEHGFVPYGTDKYTDEDGLQKFLTVEADGKISITDDSKTTKVFARRASPEATVSGAWHLEKIIDKNGNTITFSFDASLRPLKISLTPSYSTQIDMLEFYYYSSGALRMIYNSTSKDAVVFRYSSTYNGAISAESTGYLREISFAHGNTAVSLSDWESFAAYSANTNNISIDATVGYSYDSLGKIISASDLTAGQTIAYTWTANSVTQLTHTAEGSEGQSISIVYGTGHTAIRSSGNDESLYTADDIITNYALDRYGRAVSVYSESVSGGEILGAVSGEYQTQENVKNKLKEETVLGGAPVNLLLNGGFEKFNTTQLFNWNFGGPANTFYWYYDPASSTNDGVTNVKFNPSVEGWTFIEQAVTLDAGTYTLSFEYESFNALNVTAEALVTYPSTGAALHLERIPLNGTNRNGILSSFSTSFNISTAGAYNVVIRFILSAQSGVAQTVELDNVSLVKKLGAAHYSSVSYGNFEERVSYLGSTVPLGNYWTTNTGAAASTLYDGALFGYSAMVNASFNNSSYIMQRVFEADAQELASFDSGLSSYSPNAGADYIVSGFAKAPDAILSERGEFAILVIVGYYQGAGQADMQVSHRFKFTPGIDGWQYTGGSFNTGEVPEGFGGYHACVRYVDVYCSYSFQAAGYALFDNISVVSSRGSKDVERYTYYENGLLARKESLSYSEYYEYDEHRNLSRVANDRGEITDYFFTDNGQLSLIAAYEFTYNGSKKYPYYAENPNSLIVLTPKTQTVYTYYNSGLPYIVETYSMDENHNRVTDSGYMYTEYSYSLDPGSRIYGALTRELDGTGSDIRYYYDGADGKLLASVNAAENTGYAYSYDERDRLISVRPASYSAASNSYTVTLGSENASYGYNGKNLLTSLSTAKAIYNYSYDAFGNTTAVSINGATIESYTYNQKNGKLNKISYGNGAFEEYVYNALEMLTEIWYNGVKAYEYKYTATGQVAEFTDHLSGRSVAYSYDTSDRLVRYREYRNGEQIHEFSADVFYDVSGDVSSVIYAVELINSGAYRSEDSFTYFYQYNPDGSVNRLRILTATSDGGEYFYYDKLGRLYQKLVSTTSGSGAYEFRNQLDYSYKTEGSYTSGLVASVTSSTNLYGSVTTSFTYDKNGNITKILYSSGEEIRYVYDDIGQLIREDNGKLNATYVYTYDNAGNITSKQSYSLTPQGVTPTALTASSSYAYTDVWGDKLTAFNGVGISYDAMGNPLSYYNGSSYSFAWTASRLSSAVKGGIAYAFTYNENGIRTSKTKAGVTTTYYLNGSQIIAEETNGNVTEYLYDTNGAPLGIRYHGAGYAENVFDMYWFEKNIFGDIVAVYNHAGIKLISYSYDAFGNHATQYHNGGEATTASANPFRYRGYYFDQDLGLYYLNSRYYDSNTCRFISPDSVAVVTATPGSVSDKNLYAYCNNNPVMYIDYCGYFAMINSEIFVETAKDVALRTKDYDSFSLQERTSDGWELSSDMIQGVFGRVGFSSYETHIEGKKAILYAYYGSNVDVLNIYGTVGYGGIGMDLLGIAGIELQAETLGLSVQASFGKACIIAKVNLAGTTALTLGKNIEIEDNTIRMKGFTFEANTGMIFAIVYWVAKAYYTGDLTPVPIPVRA